MNYRLLTIISLLSLFISTASAQEWEGKCLADCFGTGHDCKYCSYECEITPSYHIYPNYDGDMTCPLEGYGQDNNS